MVWAVNISLANCPARVHLRGGNICLLFNNIRFKSEPGHHTVRWEGLQLQGRLRERGQCEWWPGCKLLPLAADFPGGVESGRSWLGPGRQELRRQGFRRQQGPGRRHCYGSERVLELALGSCGRVLLQSGTGLKQKSFTIAVHQSIFSGAAQFHGYFYPAHL